MLDIVFRSSRFLISEPFEESVVDDSQSGVVSSEDIKSMESIFQISMWLGSSLFKIREIFVITDGIGDTPRLWPSKRFTALAFLWLYPILTAIQTVFVMVVASLPLTMILAR